MEPAERPRRFRQKACKRYDFLSLGEVLLTRRAKIRRRSEDVRGNEGGTEKPVYHTDTGKKNEKKTKRRHFDRHGCQTLEQKESGEGSGND